MRNNMFRAAVLTGLVLISTGVIHAEGPDGLMLYNDNCAKCHGGIESSNINGRSYSRIRSAVKNVGRMGSIRDMKDNDLKIIADVLIVAGDPEDVDGGNLYGVLCSGCHKGLDNSTIAGATADDIRAAKKADKCSSDHADILNDTFIEKIADALKPYVK